MAGDCLTFNGIVKDAAKNANFLVEVDGVAKPILCTLSGKIKQNNIKILSGDRVDIEVSVYDTSKGRITYRHK